MQQLKGIGASAGVAIAKAYRLEEPDLTVHQKDINDPETEVKRFEEAIHVSKQELEAIKEHALKELGQHMTEAEALYPRSCLNKGDFRKDKSHPVRLK
ncbi:hypothetical protein BSAF29S_04861 [Bacillus safensis subsp. safensis]